MSFQPIMLDVDTGVDDAAAIAYALGLEADLVAVSTVAGNIHIDLTTGNTLKVLSLLGAEDVPVFRGASRPLIKPFQDAAHIHGGNGLGGATIPDALADEADLTAPEAIIAMAEEFQGDLTFVAAGPLTNLAIALSLRPQIAQQIGKLVLMGGAFFNPGNVTPYAEFNIWADPDAAAQVFATEWNEVIAIGLDVTHQVAITTRMWEAIPEKFSGAAGLMRKIAARTFTERVRSGFFLHDPLAVAVALDESLVTLEPYAVEVVTDGEERGRTIVRDGGNVLIATEVKAEVFLRRFCDALGMPYVQDDAGLDGAE
ncbi:MAG: nucleoside hydrolase [Thermomicrobiales bacterium]|nr:nucleoside hydrolase [Thermomicrobiales bacterium]